MRIAKIISKEDEIEICKDYNNGLSQKIIAEKHKIYLKTISKIIKKNSDIVFKIHKDEMSISKDYMSGISKLQIAIKYSTCKTVINKIIKLFDVKPVYHYEKNIINICSDYINNINKKDIMAKYSISSRKLSRILKNNNAKKNEKIINESNICNDYVFNSKTKKYLIENNSLTRGELEKVLDSNNVVSVGHKINSYSIDTCFFEKIDTKEKAYILGFLYADGTINDKTNSSLTMALEIQEQDKYILEKMNIIMKNNRPLYFRKKRKESDQNQLKIVIISDKICNDLINLGMNFRKTWNIKYPKFIDQEFQSHFIRGFFDGDGCITIKKNKKNCAMWNICGPISMCNEVKKHLESVNIKSSVYESKRCSQPFGIVSITDNLNLKKIYNYMYDNSCDLFLTRKKDKFLQLDLNVTNSRIIRNENIKKLFDEGLVGYEIAKKLNITQSVVAGVKKKILKVQDE